MERKVAWNAYDENQLAQVDLLAQEYRAFLDSSKTERECVQEIIRQAEAKGYRDLDELIQKGEKLQAGDRVYRICMGKTVALFNMGSRPLADGLTILGAHIDSPRIDIKQNPLYEEAGAAYLDTHYYGGIKKYQWVTIPLAIHGVVVKKDGSIINVAIGDKTEDPVFCITDLLIHLAGEQLDKRARKVVEGEKLDLLFASRPLKDEEGEAVKANVLKLLLEQYDMEEEDFLSAELEVVPAGPAREAGLDRSMILAYGQDDRVCAFTSLVATLEAAPQERTVCCFLCDKEEIGSVGATGARSHFFENTVAELVALQSGESALQVARCLANSRMLSSDVSAIYDPLYGSFFEKKNSAYLGKGVVFNKFTGSGGKSNSNDANPEFFAAIRNILDAENIHYQTAELGKVDFGGGGTIAYIFALYGMEVIDSGVGVLNMHAPWELTSKADIFEAKRCYAAFINGMN